MNEPTEARSFTRRVIDGVATPRGIAILFAAGTVLRLVLAIWGGFQGDLDIFKAWSQRLVDVGVGNFYDPGYFADYPPGYLYVLWVFGKLSALFGSDLPSNYLLKLPGDPVRHRPRLRRDADRRALDSPFVEKPRCG